MPATGVCLATEIHLQLLPACRMQDDIPLTPRSSSFSRPTASWLRRDENHQPVSFEQNLRAGTATPSKRGKWRPGRNDVPSTVSVWLAAICVSRIGEERLAQQQGPVRPLVMAPFKSCRQDSPVQGLFAGRKAGPLRSSSAQQLAVATARLWSFPGVVRIYNE